MNAMDAFFKGKGLPGFVDSARKITSPPTHQYNCIAWAFEDPTKWWWPQDHPDAHWPIDCDGLTTLEAFEAWFDHDGWELTQNPSYEAAYRKVALYADANGEPTHAARLLEEGKWTSKLGPFHDVWHGYNELDGPAYGSIIRIYKKPL